ncbi:MAG: YfiR family protein [Betaproteobacteria bacterium]|nr:YfiR family protein [Betaproteobacteria bacterium]
MKTCSLGARAGNDRLVAAGVPCHRPGTRALAAHGRLRFPPRTEARGCHVLFVPEAREPSAAELVRAAKALPVLTVGDGEGFAEDCGSIGFVTRDDRVQFEINPEAAARACLTVSSQLLRLATIVRDGRRARP